MTAKELIKLLEKIHPDCPIYYDHNDYEYGEGCSDLGMQLCGSDSCSKEHPHMLITLKEWA